MNAIHKLIPLRVADLSPEGKQELFEQAKSYQHERAMMGRSALLAGWCIGGTGAVIGLAGMICAATLFPLKTREVEYYIVDQASGFTGPSAGAKDAPSLFNEQVIHHVLREYVELRENYLYEVDNVAFHRVTLMSTSDEQRRFKLMHDDPAAPARALREKGYVQIEVQRISKIGDGKAKTLQYEVKLERREMRTGQPVPIKGEFYTAEISLQFHPEYPMAAPDRRLNATGLQVLSYRVTSDNPNLRTK